MPALQDVPLQSAALFMDTVTCELQEVKKALNRLAPKQEPGTRREAVASAPSRFAFDAAPAGELAGPNPRRSGFYVHNATDGTLLILFGESEATPERYTLAIGPGDWFASEKVSQELVKGPISYAWITVGDDLSAYPAGTFKAATAGALMFTEEAIKER